MKPGFSRLIWARENLEGNVHVIGGTKLEGNITATKNLGVAGALAVSGNVDFGRDGTATIRNALRVKGDATFDKDITEGGKMLKQKYQPKGTYLSFGKDAKVKNLTATGELKIGDATIAVVRCKFFRNQFNGFQGYFPAHPGDGWHEHLGWDSDCIMVKTNNGTVYLGPFG